MSDTTHPVRTAGQLDAVERRLTITPHESVVGTAATISQVFATEAADLWDACTSAERLARWFAPVSGDLRHGGRYQVQDNAGGVVERCEPPLTFSVTWELDGSTSRVTVTIDPVDDEHARLSLELAGDVPRAFWDRFGPGAGGVGWDLAMLGLARYLATGAEQPAETTAWGASEDARRFMADSSRRWADAAVAAGTDEVAARAAEERATAFYTGG